MARLEGSLNVTGTVTAGEFAGLREVKEIEGNGTDTQFQVTHQLSGGSVVPILYDAQGRLTYTAWRKISNTSLELSFFFPPQPGEKFEVILCY